MINLKALKASLPFIYEQISDGMVKKADITSVIDQLIKIAEDYERITETEYGEVELKQSNVVHLAEFKARRGPPKPPPKVG